MTLAYHKFYARNHNTHKITTNVLATLCQSLHTHMHVISQIHSHKLYVSDSSTHSVSFCSLQKLIFDSWVNGKRFQVFLTSQILFSFGLVALSVTTNSPILATLFEVCWYPIFQCMLLFDPKYILYNFRNIHQQIFLQLKLVMETTYKNQSKQTKERVLSFRTFIGM